MARGPVWWSSMMHWDKLTTAADTWIGSLHQDISRSRLIFTPGGKRPFANRDEISRGFRSRRPSTNIGLLREVSPFDVKGQEELRLQGREARP